MRGLSEFSGLPPGVHMRKEPLPGPPVHESGQSPQNQTSGSSWSSPFYSPRVRCLASPGETVLLGWCPLGAARCLCPCAPPQELGLLQEYLLALTTDDHLLRCAAQVLSLCQSWPSPRPRGLHGALSPPGCLLVSESTWPIYQHCSCGVVAWRMLARIGVFETETTSALN